MSTPEQPPPRIDDAITDRLLTLISDEVATGDEPIEPSTDLLLTGLVDSLGVVVIVDWLEAELGIEIDPGDVILEHFQTVDAMLAYLRAR